MIKNAYLGLLGAFLITSLLSSCQSEQEKAYNELTQLEKSLFGDRTALNDSIARVYISKSESYVTTYKTDERIPDIKFKQGEILNGLGSYSFAIRKFQDIYLGYPKSPKAPESIFLCAFINDSQLQNYERAEYYYKLFLKNYPNHVFAKDAKISLDNLGKTPEELVREFEKKNQPDSSTLQ